MGEECGTGQGKAGRDGAALLFLEGKEKFVA